MNTNHNLPLEDSFPSDGRDDLHRCADHLLDEAERMIWALLDDSIEQQELDQLESLIAENDAVRTRYVECVQLHVDLTEHFRAAKSASQASGDPNAVVNQVIAEHLPNLSSLPHVQD